MNLQHIIGSVTPKIEKENEIPAKRRRMDSNTPVSDGRDLMAPTTKFSIIHRRLLQNAATATQLRKFEDQIGEIFRDEISSLEVLVDVDNKVMEQLETAPGTSEKSIPVVLELGEIAEPEMGRIKSRIMKKITKLLTSDIETNQLGNGDRPKVQHNQSETQKKVEDIEEKEKFEEENMKNHKFFTFKFQQPMLLPEISEESGSSLETEDSRDDGTLPTACVQVDLMQEKGKDDAEELNFLGVLPKASLHPTDDKKPKPGVVDLCSPVPKLKSTDVSSKASSRGLMMKIGALRYIVSHPNTEIDRIKIGNIVSHYTQHSTYHFSCHKCSLIKKKKCVMEDHVWVKHMGGTLRCPYCSKDLETRSGLSQHIDKFHHRLWSLNKSTN